MGGCVFTLELPEVNPSEKSVLLLKKVFDVCMETALRSEAPERALWSSKVQALRGAYEVFIRAPQFKNLPVETPVDPEQWGFPHSDVHPVRGCPGAAARLRSPGRRHEDL